jgi:hypothetical protein
MNESIGEDVRQVGPAEDDGMPVGRVSVDARYRAYMNLYKNFDTIIWGNSRNFIAITVIGMGLIGTASSNEKIMLSPYFDHAQTIGLGVALVGLLFFLSVLVMARTRAHHTMLGHELEKLEGEGYFASRARSVANPWRSAPHWHIAVFSTLSIAALAIGVSMIVKESLIAIAHFTVVASTAIMVVFREPDHESPRP